MAVSSISQTIDRSLFAQFQAWLKWKRLFYLTLGGLPVILIAALIGVDIAAGAVILGGMLLLTLELPRWTHVPIAAGIYLAFMMLVGMVLGADIAIVVVLLSLGLYLSTQEIPENAVYGFYFANFLLIYLFSLLLLGIGGFALGALVGLFYVLSLHMPARIAAIFYVVNSLTWLALGIAVFDWQTMLIVLTGGGFLLFYHPVRGRFGMVLHGLVSLGVLVLGLTVVADLNMINSRVVGGMIGAVTCVILLPPSGFFHAQVWERGVISSLELHSWYGRAVYRLIMIFLLLLSVTVIFPFIFTFTTGLKDVVEIRLSGLKLWPQKPLWENYDTVWARFDFIRLFQNTFLLVTVAVFIQIAISTLAAYSLSRLKPKGGNIIMIGFLITLMIPGIAYLVPLYVTANDLDLIGSYWGIWLPAGVNAFMIFVLKSFFDNLPSELFDAAKVDGASSLQILGQIVLPLSRPILLVFSILTFVNLWKDFLWPYLILLPEPAARHPIAVYLYNMAERQSPPPLNLQMAAYFIAMIPPLITAVVLQRYVRQGLSFGGVKG